MMNNNQFRSSTEDSLKELFCIKMFPQLKLFLSNFDISTEIERVKMKQFHNSFDMEFLLSAFDYTEKERTPEELKKVEEKKKKVKWKYDINDANLMFAIDEYFYITSETTGNDILYKTRNSLLNILLGLKLDVDAKEGIEDYTMRAILDYFGIETKNAKKLGNLPELFCNFANKSQSNFVNYTIALELLTKIRNWGAHRAFNVFNSTKEIILYHQFVIFTYIGLVYMCRNIWKSHNYKLINNKGKDDYILPAKAQNYEAPSESVEIIPKLGDNNNIIYQFNYYIGKIKIDSSLPKRNGKELCYSIEIPKYQDFTIDLTDKNGSRIYQLEGMLDYSMWPVKYTLLPKPQSPDITLKEIPELSQTANTIVSTLFSSMKGLADETRIAVMHEIGQLLTLLQVDNKKLEEELSEKIETIQALINDIKNKNEQTPLLIQKIHNSIKGLYEKYSNGLFQMTDSLDELKQKGNEVITITKEIRKDTDYLKKSTNLIRNSLGYFFSFILLIFAWTPLIVGDFKQIDTILLWEEHKWLWILIACPILSYFSLSYLSTDCGLHIKTKKALKWFLMFLTIIPFVIALLWGCLTRTIIRDYNFLQNDSQQNEKIVKLMELHLSDRSIDEDTRIQLARYYQDFSNNPERALAVVSPMLDDVNKYKKGVLAIAQVLYSQGKDYWKVRDLLKAYKENSGDRIVTNRIEGIMYLWGQGQSKNVTKGLALLKSSADSGDTEAQYYLGYALCHDMTDWDTPPKDSVKLSDYNLIDAIRYLRMASQSKPKAALELGKLYADICLNDSAKAYLSAALLHTSGDLYKEALYRLGLLLGKSKIGEKYVTKAAFLDYEPAILYKAKNDSDHKAAIELYNRPGGYQGYRYIPPIVFEYLALGQRNNALRVLQKERPFGKFNMDFILGIEAMLGSPRLNKDSVLGMKYIESSKEEGCLYAEMISIFRNWNNSENTKKQFGRLEEIGEEIPFANILLSNLQADEAKKVESSSGFDAAKPKYEDAVKTLARAINQNHPYGAFALATNANLFGYYFHKMISRLYDISEVKQDMGITYRVLRFVPYNYKYFFAQVARSFDNKYQLISEDLESHEKNRQFWCDIAIEYNYLEFIMQLLLETKLDDVEYTKRLFSAALQNVNANSDEIIKRVLCSRACVMQKEGYSSFIDALKKSYSGDELRKKILSGGYPQLNEGDEVRIHLNWVQKTIRIDDEVILKEFDN